MSSKFDHDQIDAFKRTSTKGMRWSHVTVKRFVTLSSEVFNQLFDLLGFINSNKQLDDEKFC